jgi:hypothetical protein
VSWERRFLDLKALDPKDLFSLWHWVLSKLTVERIDLRGFTSQCHSLRSKQMMVPAHSRTSYSKAMPAGSCFANHRRAAILLAKTLISMESPTFFEAAM